MGKKFLNWLGEGAEGYEVILGKRRRVRYVDSERNVFFLIYQDDVREVGTAVALSRQEWGRFLKMRREMERELKKHASGLPKEVADEIVALATNRAIGLGKKQGIRTIEIVLEELENIR